MGSEDAASKYLCVHPRISMIIWGYVKLILMLLSVLPLYIFLVITIFNGTPYEEIIFWVILLTYPLAFAFHITLIVGLHRENLNILIICFYYLIFELVLLTIIAPFVLKVLSFEVNVPACVLISSVMFLIVGQGIYSILLTRSVINKLIKVSGVCHLEAGYTNLKDGKVDA